MAPERKEKETKNAKQPDYDGDTFLTQDQRKSGVGNEPPVKDLRERGDELEEK